MVTWISSHNAQDHVKQLYEMQLFFIKIVTTIAAQIADQGLHCLLTESLETIECIREQRPG